MNHNVQSIKQKYGVVVAHLDERGRRLWAAEEAKALGYGGVSAVSKATGLSRRVIHAGIKELRQTTYLPPHRSRRSGGGRKSVFYHYPNFRFVLENLIEPLGLSNPRSTLSWTCKGLSWLSCEMSRRGIAVSKQTIANKLVEFGYSNLRHRMVIEGQPCPDCHAQYAYINDTSAKFLTSGTPVIAIISRRTIHNPITTAFNLNTCYFGIDQADIFSIAMQSIAAWWREEGKALNVNSNKIMIIFDYGGGSSADNLSWNHELRRFVNEFGLSVAVSHFPPGIRRWNVSEHRLLTYLYKSHAGDPLLTYQTTVDLIGRASNTTPIKLERKWTRTRSEPPVRSYRGRHEW